MHKHSLKAIRIFFAGLTLVAGVTIGRAETMDSGLIGAWTTSASDCARIFQKRNGVISYRKPVDKFARAAIIEPRRIVAPASACRVLGVAHLKDSVSVKAECEDSVSFITQTIQIKIQSPTEIIYSPAGQQSLDTTLFKCAL
jgi:hypothetical protein